MIPALGPARAERTPEDTSTPTFLASAQEGEAVGQGLELDKEDPALLLSNRDVQDCPV